MPCLSSTGLSIYIYILYIYMIYAYNILYILHVQIHIHIHIHIHLHIHMCIYIYIFNYIHISMIHLLYFNKINYSTTTLYHESFIPQKNTPPDLVFVPRRAGAARDLRDLRHGMGGISFPAWYKKTSPSHHHK